MGPDLCTLWQQSWNIDYPEGRIWPGGIRSISRRKNPEGRDLAVSIQLPALLQLRDRCLSPYGIVWLVYTSVCCMAPGNSDVLSYCWNQGSCTLGFCLMIFFFWCSGLMGYKEEFFWDLALLLSFKWWCQLKLRVNDDWVTWMVLSFSPSFLTMKTKNGEIRSSLVAGIVLTLSFGISMMSANHGQKVVFGWFWL